MCDWGKEATFWLELLGGSRRQNSSVLKLSPAQFYFFSLLTETPWPLHMHEITGFSLVDLLDCTLQLHQQWYLSCLHFCNT